MELQNIIPEQKQEDLPGDEKVVQFHAELELCINKRDSVFL